MNTEQRSFTVLYEIQLTSQAQGLATQQVRYDQTKKINCGGANFSQTHNIIIIILLV